MYYIVDKTSRAVIRTSSTPFNVDEAVKPTGNVVQLKGIEDNSIPAFDATTQRLNRNFKDDDAAGTRTFYYEVLALTQPELDANATAAANETQRQQIKAGIAALRAGTGTDVQRLARLEKAVAYLLKDSLQ